MKDNFNMGISLKEEYEKILKEKNELEKEINDRVKTLINDFPSIGVDYFFDISRKKIKKDKYSPQMIEIINTIIETEDEISRINIVR